MAPLDMRCSRQQGDTKGKGYVQQQDTGAGANRTHSLNRKKCLDIITQAFVMHKTDKASENIAAFVIQYICQSNTAPVTAGLSLGFRMEQSKQIQSAMPEQPAKSIQDVVTIEIHT